MALNQHSRAGCGPPASERTDREVIEKQPYALVRQGNEAVWIDPPGRNCPLYQRGHYRLGETLWRCVRRSMPADEIPAPAFAEAEGAAPSGDAAW